VRPKEAQLTAGEGIEIVGKSKEKILEGTVVRVGDGRMLNGKLVPLLVSPGDKIYFQGARPIEVDVDGETLYVMSEGEVLAILDDSEA
jgi:chaperonin GroES